MHCALDKWTRKAKKAKQYSLYAHNQLLRFIGNIFIPFEYFAYSHHYLKQRISNLWFQRSLELFAEDRHSIYRVLKTYEPPRMAVNPSPIRTYIPDSPGYLTEQELHIQQDLRFSQNKFAHPPISTRLYESLMGSHQQPLSDGSN